MIELKPLNCPSCLQKLDAALGVESRKDKPAEGDIGLCFKCAEILEYYLDSDNQLSLRKASSETLDIVKDMPQLHLAIRAIKLTNVKFGRAGTA